FEFFGKTERDALVFFQIQRDESIELSSIRDRRDVSDVQSGGGVEFATHADPVIGLDPREIEIHELRCCELLRAKGLMHSGNRGFRDSEGGFPYRLFVSTF